ncbi:MAG: Npt1/Npt2 family nucleotide transporter [Rickettsiaceae bacterium]|nr:Npt1/Npt2 family nucleotide transporter [Rickettsiaceae bacterium]
MTISLHPKFLHRIREFIWPIKRQECHFFIPMALIMTCALYNFACLRAVKDSLIVSNVGAESISFLKLWFVLPAAIIFTLFYLNLSNKYTIDKVFYIITTGFLLFFLVFTLYILPNKNLLHPPTENIEKLVAYYPNFKWFLKIAGHWTFAIMYILSELWSVVVINLMFWQFANNVVDASKAKRFYPIFGVVGNFGLIIAGNNLIYFAKVEEAPTFLSGLGLYALQFNEDIGIKLAILSVIFSGVLMLLLMLYLNITVLKDTNIDNKITKIKTKLSLADSLKLVLSSSYVGYITALIICYGLAINILEGPWKASIKEYYKTQEDYMAFMGVFNVFMGISCVLFMIIGSNILRIFSWTTSALFTPVVIGITGVAFFIFVIISRLGSDFLWFHPLFGAILAGAIQNILSKSSKYSLFDSTKEMAYIPLPPELKTKGKAAAEVIGAKFGKSVGAVIQSFMFTFLPNCNFYDLTPVLLSIFLLVIMFWYYNVMKLAKDYEEIASK